MELKIFIPPSLEPAAPEIRRFFDAMVYKLRKNSHKGKWENMKPEDCLSRAMDELGELKTAIEEGNSVEVMLEAADVANFSLMAANIAIMEGKK